MIRFVRTADWQMVMKASGLGTAFPAVHDVRQMQQLLTEKVRGNS